MANQYTPVIVTMEKCADPDCDVLIRMTPSRKRKGSKYCCREHAYKSNTLPRKYQAADIAWIIENTGKVSRADMIKMYNTNDNAFKRMMCILRGQGHLIPKLPKNQNPNRRKSQMTDEQMKYVDDNYQRMNIPELARNIKVESNIILNYVQGVNRRGEKLLIKKSRKAMPAKKGKVENLRKHNDRKPPVAPPKRREEVFKTRKIDEKGLIPVVFNDKNKTKMFARDEAHADRIRTTYAYLNKPASQRFK